jgi:lysophospholipase L1-like esterase
MRFTGLVAAILIWTGTVTFADFAVRDGDTVVFLGDSITAARQYGKVIENYTLLRFPNRKVKFINAGKGGETAHGSLDRLDTSVFGRGATLVTVAYDVNDIGWGMKADEPHQREYLDAIAEIVERCKKHNVRVFICSAAITAEDPDKAENGFLQKMCDAGLALAKSKGAGTIDIQRTMREVQRRALASDAKKADKSKPTRLHVEDGVHLNDLGQMAMAYAILKGLDAPANVSSASIDAKENTVRVETGCKISDLKNQAGIVSFTRVDERLPLNLSPLWMLHGMYIPIGADLNRYMLTIDHLYTGDYEITANGRSLGTWSSSSLAAGLNIASATADPWIPGGPWDAQAHIVKILTDMRDEIAFARQGMDQTLSSHPRIDSLDTEAEAIEKSIVNLQRNTARAIPIRFIIAPKIRSK